MCLDADLSRMMLALALSDYYDYILQNYLRVCNFSDKKLLKPKPKQK